MIKKAAQPRPRSHRKGDTPEWVSFRIGAHPELLADLEKIRAYLEDNPPARVDKERRHWWRVRPGRIDALLYAVRVALARLPTP